MCPFGLQYPTITALCHKLHVTQLAHCAVSVGAAVAQESLRTGLVDVASIPVPAGAKLYVYTDDLVTLSSSQRPTLGRRLKSGPRPHTARVEPAWATSKF